MSTFFLALVASCEYSLFMTNTMTNWMDARRERLLRELQSDLCDLVQSGDITDDQANEWYNAVADRWAAES